MTPVIGKKVLIVEDERHIGMPLKFNCEAEGYDATLVEDGPSAIRQFESNPAAFDLVILDRYQNRDILPPAYFDNIARYVENGGALLLASGPELMMPPPL